MLMTTRAKRSRSHALGASAEDVKSSAAVDAHRLQKNPAVDPKRYHCDGLYASQAFQPACAIPSDELPSWVHTIAISLPESIRSQSQNKYKKISRMGGCKHASVPLGYCVFLQR